MTTEPKNETRISDRDLAAWFEADGPAIDDARLAAESDAVWRAIAADREKRQAVKTPLLAALWTKLAAGFAVALILAGVVWWQVGQVAPPVDDSGTGDGDAAERLVASVQTLDSQSLSGMNEKLQAILDTPAPTLQQWRESISNDWDDGSTSLLDSDSTETWSL